jgi:hypothetical protein
MKLNTNFVCATTAFGISLGALLLTFIGGEPVRIIAIGVIAIAFGSIHFPED